MYFMESREIKILAIDDNQDNLISIKALVGESFPDILVLTALTGNIGLELAASEDPDVILLDIVMPGMDGFEVCNQLKADKELCNIPVVFVTAIKGDKESRIKALDCGAEAFLAKPIDPSELTAQIRAMVKIKAANTRKHDEKKRLEELVEDRTIELYRTHAETLRLYVDLKKENLARKRSEKTLRESEEKYRMSEAGLKKAQAVAHLGNWQWSIKTNKVTLSDEMFQIFGIDKDSYTGLLEDVIKNVIHPDDLQIFMPLNAQEFSVRKPQEFRIIRPDQSIRYIWAEAGETMFDENGNPIFLSGIAQDITDRKLLEQDLIVAKERAEEGDRLKTAFLANMSHEIRTPMNGILGFAGLLKEQKLTGEEQQEYIAIIEKSGYRMLNIINDIVDISKIESGQMNIYLSPTNINKQIEYTYNFFRQEAEKKGLHLLFKKTLPSKHAVITTDREKVYAILTNLVKNAIKFTPSGSIEFGYYLDSVALPTRQLTFYVKDSGIGIPKDRQKAVFDRFVQADIGDKRAFQGAGLGLSISKAYVQMLGGRIWVESEEGKGSSFFFSLPYNLEKTKKTENIEFEMDNEEQKQTNKLKILIAEDDYLNEKLISIGVKMLGKEILKARTGIEAVEACRNNPDIDLVLMDIKMPEMNGYEATREIRKFNNDVIIIAQTAYALVGDREKAIEAGCNNYIAKPFDKSALISLIEQYFER